MTRIVENPLSVSSLQSSFLIDHSLICALHNIASLERSFVAASWQFAVMLHN